MLVTQQYFLVIKDIIMDVFDPKSKQVKVDWTHRVAIFSTRTTRYHADIIICKIRIFSSKIASGLRHFVELIISDYILIVGG